MDRARGATITDVEGKTYIDFVAGIAVMNVGHSNPEVSAAVTAQMEKMALRAVHAHYGYCYRCPLHLTYPDCGIESYRYVHGNGKFRRKG